MKTEKDAYGTFSTTNGMDDNEDIYGPNQILDGGTNGGEDVIDAGIDCSTNLPKKGTLQNDTSELPDPVALAGTSGGNDTERLARANAVASWSNLDGTTPTNHKYFRSAVRLFNGENLQNFTSGNKLSTTKGITVAAENMVFIWGNYNTQGITSQPSNGSSLNDGNYRGPQVPASIVADAFTPLSKTWFDSMSSFYPDDVGSRTADYNLPSTNSIQSETSMRCGIIAGDTMGALAGSPDAGNGGTIGESRLNGGMHNFPRFLESWGGRWNFVGALIPLFHSTQAMGPYNANSTIYGAPVRNWAFDDTFKTPSRLPPGTPVFQYIEPTGFRQVL